MYFTSHYSLLYSRITIVHKFIVTSFVALEILRLRFPKDAQITNREIQNSNEL